MIKLQDFARECGVTDRQIQRLLKKYEEELTGHFERKGPNGTWLDEEARQILRSRMKQQPIVVGDGEIYRRNADLEQEVKDLNAELKDAYKEQAQMLRQLGELRGVQARLEASETARLALTEARDDFKALAEKKDEEAAAARQEADRLRAELQTEKARADALAAAKAAYDALPWWKKPFWKGE